ncbi:glycerophosphoryl diester phosphodiesterase membrane domain-containing protein [Streptomyces chumphonensis]|uniref:Glycerophosphoryl diester phosphodiesterase membrane domain-containing protein n=1 Tax=Streptomyces chumphonensis TaxID=1214925 RepID=A0A927IA99_9ACTN|nr:glycerophosphoryl diester phosphodiesterase membrane domain-containing protein [Streptomyces chumphonensis]MBD3930973.1 glycerophosphoryl diester phosphodiesterase membrane domain-containing protein [Streptomyces chumphonensis]
MNDAPGWASPGSSEPEPHGDKAQGTPAAGDGPQHGERPAQADRPAPTGWSAQQPPSAGPTGWDAPGSPPGRPDAPAGWGQGPGWGGPQQYGAPYAHVAKPGVIPLRPLGVGEVLDGAVSTMRAHWRPVLGIALGIAVLVQLVTTVATGLWFSDMGAFLALEDDTSPTAEELSDALGPLLGSEAVHGLMTVVGTVIATAMLTMIVSRAVLGRPVSIGEAWRDARPLLGKLLGLTLLVTLIVLGVLALCLLPGAVLAAAGSTLAGSFFLLIGSLGGLVLMVWLWVRFSLSAPALMLERGTVIAALRRSGKLVRGSWWRIFGIQLLAALLVFVLSLIVSVPVGGLASLVDGSPGGSLLGDVPATLTWPYLIVTAIGAVVTSTLTLPFSAGVTALLYIDARIRREALDLELARAAGVPGHGPQQPGPGTVAG